MLRSMPRDTRTRRDLHALDEDGMVLCNPRDREAAHRAETEGIATDDPAAVTCPACIDLLHRRARAARTGGDGPAAAGPAGGHAGQPAFVRVRDAAGLVGHVREGDGIDPRLERRGGGRKPDHGAERLARQIFDSLQFSSALSDVGLDEFAFVGVVPGGRPGQFIVEVAALDPALAYDPHDIERRLAACRPGVRAEVAAGVHRRKAPEITFRVRLPGAGPG